MSFVVARYLPWIAMALFVGLAAGWLGAERRRDAMTPRVLLLALAGVALACWIAFMHVLPGRAGHMFELLLALLVGYVFGRLIGEPLRLALAPPAFVRAAAANISAPLPPGPFPPDLAAMMNAPPPARAAAIAPAPAHSLDAIANIGPKTIERLAGLGVKNVSEIANWSAEDAAFIGEKLGEPGRAEREMWIAQARLLASGVETPHSIAMRMGRAPATAADEADVPVSDEHKPDLLQAPPESPDDLKLIWGVGPKLAGMLNDMGVYRFEQIASWNEMNLRWVDQNLKQFRGRAVRDRWIEQAKKLAGGWRPESEVGDKFEG